MSIHYPVGEDHQTSRKDSFYRAPICDRGGNRKMCIAITHHSYNASLSDIGSFYSLNINQITCKKCRSILLLDKIKNNNINRRVEIIKRREQIRLLEIQLEILENRFQLYDT